MRLRTFYLFIFILTIQINGMSQTADSVSYSIGVVLAQNLKKEGIKDINHEKLSKAISDVLGNHELEISLNESKSIFSEYLSRQKEMMFEINKQEGEAFLTENAKKPDVSVTDSGLQYEVLTMGDGVKPTLNDKVNVHYHGTLITGEVFDSSVERNETISFPLNGVIQGWQEGLQLMPVGSKFRFYVPEHLAYGNRGAGALIQPYSTLIFDVELFAIE